MTLDPGLKERLATVIGVVKGVFHIGFMPTVLYLGTYFFFFFDNFFSMKCMLIHKLFTLQDFHTVLNLECQNYHFSAYYGSKFDFFFVFKM